MGCLIIETSMNRRGTNPFKDLQLIGKYKKIMKQVNPEIIFSYTVTVSYTHLDVYKRQ